VGGEVVVRDLSTGAKQQGATAAAAAAHGPAVQLRRRHQRRLVLRLVLLQRGGGHAVASGLELLRMCVTPRQHFDAPRRC
jgi:hypothetical protein